jgi:mono/diheme cytochrome c family protein
MDPASVSGHASPAKRRSERDSGLFGGALCAIIGIVAIGIYAGVYNVGADTPHTRPVFWLLNTVRARSIAVRAKKVTVPTNLDDPKRVAAGAAEYEEMCSGCHLAPGMKRTEIAQGLYPRAPELRRGTDLTPAEEFWVVKHGVKSTGMPAWGVTHDDELLWNVVAFLRKLPELTAEQYQTLVKSAPSHEKMMQEMGDEAGHDHSDHSHQ